MITSRVRGQGATQTGYSMHKLDHKSSFGIYLRHDLNDNNAIWNMDKVFLSGVTLTHSPIHLGSDMFSNNKFMLLKIHPLVTRAAVSEWLRSWTRNPMGYARTGSNPVVCDIF